MDTLTETILERARERQRMMQEYPDGSGKMAPLRENNKGSHSEPNLTSVQRIPSKEVRSETNLPLRASSGNGETGQGSPTGQQTKTLNIQRDDFNMEIKVNSADNVRLEVQIEECDVKHEESVGLREESKNRLKRLGKLYAGGEEADISSPIHRTEAKFFQSIQDEKEKENCEYYKSKKGLSKLADLADTISHWEDDMSHPTRSVDKKPLTPKKTWKPPAPQPPAEKPVFSPHKASPTKSQKPKAPTPPAVVSVSPKVRDCPQKPQSPKKALFGGASTSETVPKQISWDKKVLDTLESQGFTRTQSSSRLVYSYNSQDTKEPEIAEEHLEIRNNTIPEEVNWPGTPKSSPKKTVDSPTKFRSGKIANKAALFETKANEAAAPPKPQRDPALLSLAERKALFEKNKGEALVPKAAFGMSAPVKVDTTMKACESKFIGISKSKENLVQMHKNVFEEGKSAVTVKKIAPPPPPPLADAKKVTPCQPKGTPVVAMVHQSGGIASKMAALLENRNKSTISEEQIFNKVKEERQKELDMLLNRFNKNKEMKDEDAIQEVYSDQEDQSESSEDEVDECTAMIKTKTPTIVQNRRKSAEKRKSDNRASIEADSPNVVSVLEEVKRIKVSPPKAGRLYPNLSDIEVTTTDQETRTPTPNEENSFEDNKYDSDDPNTSFGRDILQAVCKNITPTKKVTYKETSSSSENSSVMDELDEILEEMDEDDSSGPTPPKQKRDLSPKHKKPQPSNSFHYKSFTSNSSTSPSGEHSSNFQSPKKSGISPRQSMELPLVVDGEHLLCLTHTVSVYRKQQNKVHTPVRQIIRQPIIEEGSESSSIINNDVEEKIHKLEEEVNKQQNIIFQTSQALNLCSSTPEFSGSTEQVEAERVLLVATHRRQAALHELQRMKVEGTVRPLNKHSENVPLEKGTLTISNIVLPMKQKYVTALAAAGGKGHHVVCLIKCGEQVVPTKLVSTVASSSKNPDVDLYVPGDVVLNDIYSDFAVTFEVYCLQAQEECLPHEVKYHINKKSKGLVTPKKSKHENRLLRPPKESPGGPQAIRTSSFALMGYVVFSVQTVSKKVWSLNNTPSMSPLEGSVEMKINCALAVSVEHRAFLTMFEDISGFGAWHRRWCLLKGDTLSYWKYPENEKKMPPIDTIDLNNCITKQVGPVSREICARMHTFLLERERPAYPEDKDTLVVVRKGDKTIIRHLLSADTKEERIQWCNKLNSALTAIKMWGNPQH